MHVQINTGPDIDAHTAPASEAIGVVESALGRFSEHITRVEVHLSDENGDKKVGHDAMRCMMEARLEGRRPIAVTHRAATLADAITGSADKLARAIESTLGRQRVKMNRRTDPDPSPPQPELP